MHSFDVVLISESLISIGLNYNDLVLVQTEINTATGHSQSEEAEESSRYGQRFLEVRREWYFVGDIYELIVFVGQSSVLEGDSRTAGSVQVGDMCRRRRFQCREWRNDVNISSSFWQDDFELCIINDSTGKQRHDRNGNDILLVLGVPAA